MKSHDVLPVDDEILLVPRHAGDAAEMYALVDPNRAVLREWLGWVDGTRSIADMRRYAQYAEAQFESRLAFDYAIRVGGAIAGSIGLHALDWSNRNAQIGYWLAPHARGRGAVTRACAALVTFGFRQLALQRLEIRCAIGNAPSRAVPERLRFIYEGTLAEAHVLHDTFHDLALYATTASRWRTASCDTPLSGAPPGITYLPADVAAYWVPERAHEFEGFGDRRGDVERLQQARDHEDATRPMIVRNDDAEAVTESRPRSDQRVKTRGVVLNANVLTSGRFFTRLNARSGPRSNELWPASFLVGVPDLARCRARHSVSNPQ